MITKLLSLSLSKLSTPRTLSSLLSASFATDATTDADTFDQYITNSSILNSLNKHGLKTMFPIQSECFSLILKGKDILASDRTGSGKTLAYTLPILEKIYQSEPHPAAIKNPHMLILSPTRELALQVSGEIRKFAK